MDKELIDKAWACLPREFKEEVKRLYREFTFTREGYYVELFGHHNLTSDADGEEMLTVPRKDIVELYQEVQKTINQCKGTELAIQSIGIRNVLWSLFGSECLPDNIATSESNVDSLDGNVESLKPKPAEPKFKVGDYVRYKGGVHKVVATAKDNRCYLNKILSCIDESDLEPYTETKEDTAENRNWSQYCGNCAESVQKTYPGFGHLRLTIAAQMMQGLICAPLIPGVDPNPSAEYLAQTAFRLADALIAEAEKEDCYSSELTDKLNGK